MVCGGFLYLRIKKTIQQTRVLVAVCCIDERLEELKSCTTRVLSTHKNMIGVVRRSDTQCQRFLRSLQIPTLCTNNYPSPHQNGERYDLSGLAKQRSMALEFSRQEGYAIVIFVDSDIIYTWYAHLFLIVGILYQQGDIVCVPYVLRWTGGKAILAYDHPWRIKEAKWTATPYHRCIAGGMGCTAIKVDSPRTPECFNLGEGLGRVGEDIGFFKDAYQREAVVLGTSWCSVRHQL